MADIPQNTQYDTGGAASGPAYWSGRDTQGNTFGFSNQKDISGRPFLAYRTPNATATTTDPTRVDTTFNPMVPAAIPAAAIHTPRLPQQLSTQIKSEVGGNKTQELDHSIPLELAGSNDPSNLRLEGGLQTPGGESFGFDQEENSLAGQVASGKMSLFAAQLQMARDKANTGDKNSIPFTGSNTDTTKPVSILQPNQPSQPQGGLPPVTALLGGPKTAAPGAFNPMGAFTPSTTNAPKQVFSPKLFNADFVTPLYLGGTYSVSNREILPAPVYQQKQTIQAVPFTLYSHGLISADQAKVMSSTWQDRTSVGLPQPDQTGQIPVKTALAIQKQWESNDKNGVPPTLGDVMRSVPEAADNFGKGTLPEFARELLIGGASGLTAGAVPLHSAQGANALDKISGLVGEALGTFAGISMFGGLSELAGGLLGRTAIGEALGSLGSRLGISAARGATVGDLTGGASVFEPTAASVLSEQGATQAKNISGVLSKMKTAANPANVLNNLKAFNVRSALGQAAKNAVPFALYGQTGQTLSDFTQPQQDILNNHVKRLTNDLTLGALTGVMPPSWAGSAGVAAGTFSLGMMNGESPRQALSDAVALGALHRVGGFAQDVSKQQQILKQQTDDATAKGAFTVLHTFAPEAFGVPRIDLTKAAPTIDSYTPEQVKQWATGSLDALKDMGIKNTTNPLTGAAGGLTPEQYFTARGRIMASAKYLENRQLPTDLQERAAMLDLSSMARNLKEKYDVNTITTPNTVFPFAGELSKIDEIRNGETPAFNSDGNRWIVDSKAPETEGSPENDGLRGDVRLTGQAANFSNERVIQDFIDKMKEGKAAPYLMFAHQPEMAPFWRDINRSTTPEMLKSGEHFIDEHPENFVNVFGFVKGDDGQYHIQEIGARVPSKQRIGVPTTGPDGKPTVIGNRYAFNKDTDIVNGKFPPENPNFNKDTIATAMRNRNMPVIVARVGAFSDKALKSGKPYIIAHLGDHEWDMSKNIWGQIGSPEQHSTLEENLAVAALDKGRRDVTAVLSKAAQQLADRGENAATLVSKEDLGPTNEPGQAALFEMTSKAGDVLKEANSPEEVKTAFHDKLGVDLTSEEATTIEKSREEMTGGDLINTVAKAVDEGRATPETVGSFKTYVEPLMKTNTFEHSTAGIVYEKMPLMATHEVGGRQAARISAAAQEPTGTGLLDQSPLEATIKHSPEAAPYIEQMDTIGLEPGHEMDPQAIDVYTDNLISYIKDSGAPDNVKEELAQHALQMLDYGAGETEIRNISRGRSEEAWTKQQRPEGNLVAQMRDRIQTAFNIDAAGRPMVSEDRKAMMERVQKAVTEDVKPFFDRIGQSRNAPPDTYERGYYQTFDELAKGFWGKDYQSNYNLMKVLSDKSSFGRKVWYGERDTARGPKGGLMNTETDQGKQIGQPAMVVETAGRGNRAGLSQAIADRNKQLGRTGMWPVTGEGVVDMRENPPMPTQMGENELDIYANGGRQVDPNQLPEENVQDLTHYEAERRLGMLDEIRNGADPELSPIRGAEDAANEVFGLVEAYNKGVGSGDLSGRRVGLSNAREVIASVKSDIAGERARVEKITSLANRARSEIASLEEVNKHVADIGGTRAQEVARKVVDENQARIGVLVDFLGRLEKPTAKFKNLKSDGQGGPGVSPVAPALTDAPTFTVPVTPPTSITAPDTLPFPNAVPGQSVLDYLGGKVNYQNPQTAMPLTPQKLDTVNFQPAVDAIQAGQKALSQVPQDFSSITNGVKSLGQNAFNYLRGADIFKNPNAGKGGTNPVIMGYDTTDYATDPMHAQKVSSIVSSVGELSDPTGIESYIQKKFPRSPITGNMIATSAQKYGVPPQLIIALVQNDSSMGTAGLGAKTRNPGNVGNTDSGAIRTFRTWQAGIDAVAQWLAQHKVQTTG